MNPTVKDGEGERERHGFLPVSALNAAVKKDIKTGHKSGQLMPLL